MNLPSFESYGNYRSDNYGAHCLKFYVGNMVVYFSYRTPVAFATSGHPRVVRENEWGPTTGKHLNWIDGGDKKNRIPGVEFEALLNKAVELGGL